MGATAVLLPFRSDFASKYWDRMAFPDLRSPHFMTIIWVFDACNCLCDVNKVSQLFLTANFGKECRHFHNFGEPFQD